MPWEPAKGNLAIMHGQSNMLQIAFLSGPAGCYAGLLHGRKHSFRQQSGRYGQDGGNSGNDALTFAAPAFRPATERRHGRGRMWFDFRVRRQLRHVEANRLH